LPGRYQENNIETSFQNLGLAAELLRAVAEQGYTEPTPIQSQAIPVVLAGRDLLGAAQTGTGKTAGFTLPMLQLLATRATASQSPARHPVRALVLVPTRELAVQVQESVRTYGRHMKLRAAVVYGGVGFNPQADELRRGVDIVVATPGRLLDHVEQRTVDLRQVEILVLDEADRMLDMGFIHDIRRILKLLPARRQNLLFSATFPEEVRTLAAGFMHDPVTVEVAPRNTPIELIAQVAHPVDKDRKRALLSHLVKSGNWQQVLVFCRTKHGANRLAEQLEHDGIETSAIHGNKSQPQRMKALKRFKDGQLQVLVATDIAARGIDIESLPHVVNYDLPHVPEDYVHRIGRTGRAGESGEAVALVSGEDRTLLRDIERLIGRKVEQKVIEGFEPGTAYHSAQPEPQQQRGQRGGGRQPQPRRPRHEQRRPELQRHARHGGNGQGPSGPRPNNGPRPQGRRPGPPPMGGKGRRPQEGFVPPRPDQSERAAQREYALQMLRVEGEAPAQQSSQPQQPAQQQSAPQPPRPERPAQQGGNGPQVPALFSNLKRKTG
jgi:ATP-dependent RNA helicase RhlE